MLRNYFKTTFRTLSKHKLFTLINIIGLSFSMVACLLIIKYVEFENSYDDFHAENDQLYRVYRIARGESPDDGVVSVFPGMTPVMKQQIPEFDQVARIIGSDKIFQSFAFTSYEGEDIRTFNIEKPFFADDDLLRIFCFNWLEGANTASLDEPNQVIISSSIAHKFFGDESALGQTLHFKNLDTNFLITGVFVDWNKNSHVEFDVITSLKTLPKEWDLDNDFGWGNFYTYTKLSGHPDLSLLEDKLNEKVGKRETWYEEEGITFKLQKVKDIHLTSHHSFELKANGNSDTLFFLTVIGIFIMVIAWVNYINLSTSKLIDRAKEVGIRKVLGSEKRHLISQFLLESLVINLIAILVAITILQIMMVPFEQLLGIELNVFAADAIKSTIGVLFAFALGGILFGLYPAFLFANQKIASVVKGKSKVDKRGLLLRKVLTTFQYSIAALLLFGTVGISKQLSFMQNANLGMNIEQTLIVKKPFIEEEERLTAKSSFINRVNALSSVQAVSASSEIPGQAISYARWVRLGTELGVKSTYGRALAIDSAFIDLYDIEVLHGRSFSSKFKDDKSIILSLSTAEDLLETDLESWIGRTIYYMMEPYELVGIVNDINQESMKKDPKPHIYLNDDRVRYFSIKLNTNDLPNTVAAVGDIFNDSFDSSHYEYFFLDTYFDRQYSADRLFGQIFRFFSILAIVITVLGLFGLSLYNINQRTKEIGIRKVLGAEVSQLFKLLTQDYFIMLVLAVLIGLPIGTFLLRKWLSEFANQMNLDFTLFIIPVVVLGFVTVCTVFYQVLKVAQTNPTETLRNE